jgi:hypothetical protein
LWFHRTSLPSRTWHSPGMFFLVAQGWWPEWWVYSRGFIPNKFYLHSYLRSFYVFFEYESWCFWGFNGDIYICLPSIQLFWSVSKWGWESNERGLRRVGGNRSALVVAERPGNMVVRWVFSVIFHRSDLLETDQSQKKLFGAQPAKSDMGVDQDGSLAIGLGFTVREKAYTWMLWRLVSPWHGQVGATMALWALRNTIG